MGERRVPIHERYNEIEQRIPLIRDDQTRRDSRWMLEQLFKAGQAIVNLQLNKMDLEERIAELSKCPGVGREAAIEIAAVAMCSAKYPAVNWHLTSELERDYLRNEVTPAINALWGEPN